MADYAVTLARSARKELEKLPASLAQRIIEQLEILMKNPRPVRALKLQGNRNLWRLRVGNYRVIYSIDDPARLIDVSAECLPRLLIPKRSRFMKPCGA